MPERVKTVQPELVGCNALSVMFVECLLPRGRLLGCWSLGGVMLQCRAASKVKTRQAWHAAVRHTGLLFQLPPPSSKPAATSHTAAPITTSNTTKVAPQAEASAGTDATDAFQALPYPQLSQTVSGANFAPAAHLAEHYSPPGGVFLARSSLS